MSPVSGRFLVTNADAETVILQDVTSSQVYTLATNPGMEQNTVITASLTPVDALAATWSIEDYDRYPLTVEIVDDPPTEQVLQMVDSASTGQLQRFDREWGTLHVISVLAADTAAMDIRDDPATRSRAARLGTHHVVIKSGDGVVCIEYRDTIPS